MVFLKENLINCVKTLKPEGFKLDYSTGVIDLIKLDSLFEKRIEITPSLKTQWFNKLNTDYPDINFDIKAIEDFIN
ncbi:MAG: hypothetical protein ACWA41_05760 [Putridiphycobacter sp.]